MQTTVNTVKEEEQADMERFVKLQSKINSNNLGYFTEADGSKRTAETCMMPTPEHANTKKMQQKNAASTK